MNNLMVIDGIEVRRDVQGRYCLNDLHRAAGGEDRHKPSNFMRMDSTRELCAEIDRCSDVSIGCIEIIRGGYRYILEEAKAANKLNPVSESPIDPFGATGLSHDLADENLNPVTIIQNYANMSDPMKELEAAIESGRFHHDGNPIMTWCIGNVVGKTIPGPASTC